MIGTEYVRLMTRYNRWQNQSLYASSAALSDEERKKDRGAFFGSIQKTLSHLIWGDTNWMSRLDGIPKPPATLKDSPNWWPEFEPMRHERERLDAYLDDWSARINQEWLDGDLIWVSGLANREMRRPRGFVIMHFFNHQTHHRGQVHAMLTAAGAATRVPPEDTDLIAMRG